MRVEEKKEKTNNKTVDLNAIHKLRDWAKWIFKNYPIICCFQETHCKYDIGMLKVNKWKKTYNANQKKVSYISNR